MNLNRKIQENSDGTLSLFEGCRVPLFDRATRGLLQSVSFGRYSNPGMDNVTLPIGLQSLSFGRDFNQSMDNVYTGL